MANLVVTTGLDVVNAADGVLSLREAVALANANVDSDNISFAATLAGQTLAIISGLVLTNNVSVNGDTNGDGDFDITLSDDNIGSNDFAVFTTNAGVNARLSSLSVSGLATEDSAGAIYNNGNLTLTYCVFENNSNGAFGGGNSSAPIFNTGVLTLEQTVFSGNSSQGGQGQGSIEGGRSGGHASASILNFESNQVTLVATAFIGGIAIGGNGGFGVQKSVAMAAMLLLGL